MRAHELALVLLAGPDLPVLVPGYEWGWNAVGSVKRLRVRAFQSPVPYAGAYQDLAGFSMGDLTGPELEAVALAEGDCLAGAPPEPRAAALEHWSRADRDGGQGG